MWRACEVLLGSPKRTSCHDRGCRRRAARRPAERRTAPWTRRRRQSERDRRRRPSLLRRPPTRWSRCSQGQLKLRGKAADEAAHDGQRGGGSAGEGVVYDGRTSVRRPPRRSGQIQYQTTLTLTHHLGPGALFTRGLTSVLLPSPYSTNNNLRGKLAAPALLPRPPVTQSPRRGAKCSHDDAPGREDDASTLPSGEMVFCTLPQALGRPAWPSERRK